MKRPEVLISLVLILTLPLWGQDGYPKVEIFGGYSFSHNTVESTGHNLNGWGASVSTTGTRHFGVTADFSRVYGSGPYVPICLAIVPPPAGCLQTQNLSVSHFLAGPRFTLPTHGATLFAHALLGVAHLRQEKSGTRSDFALGFGGGVDVSLRKHLAYRLLQVNYIPAKRPQSVSGWAHDFRLQTGILFTFRGK